MESHLKRLSGMAGDVLGLSRVENDAAEALLMAHEGKVQALARKWLRPELDLNELIHIGRLAVLRAAEKIDPALGSGESYVWQSINYGLSDYVRDTFSTIRLPREHFGKVWHRHDSLDDCSDDEGIRLSERIAEPSEDSSLDDEELSIVHACLSRLSDRERHVILGVFFEGQTYQSIGDSLNCTWQNVQQICQKSLWKLRRMSSLNNLKRGRMA